MAAEVVTNVSEGTVGVTILNMGSSDSRKVPNTRKSIAIKSSFCLNFITHLDFFNKFTIDYTTFFKIWQTLKKSIDFIS